MKNYELLYYYNSQDADSTITLRVPHELKDDFMKICKDGNISKALREYMIHEIDDKAVLNRNSDGTFNVRLSNIGNKIR